MSAIGASQDSADGSGQDEPPSRPGTRQVTLPVSTHAIASLPRGPPGSRHTERPPDGQVFFTKAHVSRTEAVFSQSDTGRRPVFKLRARRSCEPLSLNRTVWRCPFSVQRPEVPSRKSLGSESCSVWVVRPATFSLKQTQNIATGGGTLGVRGHPSARGQPGF